MRFRLNDETGEGRAGCLIMLLVLGLAVYLCLQIVPVYLNKIDFEEDLDRIASKAGSENWNDELIRERVEAAARVRNFELQEGDIEIRRANPFDETPRFRIIVNYRKGVQLPGYLYLFEFKSESSSLVMRL